MFLKRDDVKGLAIPQSQNITSANSQPGNSTIFTVFLIVLAGLMFLTPSVSAFNVNVTYMNNQTYEIRSIPGNVFLGSMTLVNSVNNRTFQDCDLLSCSVRYDLFFALDRNYTIGTDHLFINYYRRALNTSREITISVEKETSVRYNIQDDQRSCSTRTNISGIMQSTNCTVTTTWNNFSRNEWTPFVDGGTISNGVNKFRVTYTRTNQSQFYDLITNIFDSRNTTEFAWWNDTFNYKTNITANSLSVNTQSNFIGRLVFNSSGLINQGKMDNKCQDLRIVNSSEDVLLDYEIEKCNANDTVVYFRIPSLAAGNQTYYMYYGAPGVSSKENWTSLWRSAGFVAAYLGQTNGSAGSAFDNGSILIDSAGYNNMTRVGTPASCYANSTWAKYGYAVHSDGQCYWEKVNPTNMPSGNTSATEIWIDYFLTTGGTDSSNNAIWSYGTTSSVGMARSSAYCWNDAGLGCNANASGGNYVQRWFGDAYMGGRYSELRWEKAYTKYTNTSNLRQMRNVTVTTNNTYGNANTQLITSRIGEIAWDDGTEGMNGFIDEYLIANTSLSDDYILGFQNQLDYFGVEKSNAPNPPANATLVSPANGSTVQNMTNQTFTANGLVFGLGETVANATLYGNFTGVWKANATNTTGLVNNSLYSFNIPINYPNYYVWNVWVCSNNGACGFSPVNFTFLSVAAPLPIVAQQSSSNDIGFVLLFMILGSLFFIAGWKSDDYVLKIIAASLFIIAGLLVSGQGFSYSYYYQPPQNASVCVQTANASFYPLFNITSSQTDCTYANSVNNVVTVQNIAVKDKGIGLLSMLFGLGVLLEACFAFYQENIKAKKPEDEDD